MRKAIAENKTFDTGWVGCKKEIRWFRIISNGTVATVMASEEMDDIEDLIDDETPEEIELTEEQRKAVLELYYENGEVYTSIENECTTHCITYENIMKILSELEEENSKTLNEYAHIVRNWIEYAIDNIKEE